MRYSKRSIDFAAPGEGPQVLVCHLGSVEFLWFNPEGKLDAYIDAAPRTGGGGGPFTRSSSPRALAKLRKGACRRTGSNTQQSVTELLDYAEQKGVLLGFENREAFTELPLDRPLRGPDRRDGQAGCPAATGTTPATPRSRRTMGLLNHREHAGEEWRRAIGFHLHDVSAAGRDHQPHR
jgi:hypothetical protein